MAKKEKDDVIVFGNEPETKEPEKKAPKQVSEFAVAKNGRHVIINAEFRKKLDRIKANKAKKGKK